jgi:hypothetical protein
MALIAMGQPSVLKETRGARRRPWPVPSIPSLLKYTTPPKTVNQERRAAFPLRVNPEFPRRHSMNKITIEFSDPRTGERITEEIESQWLVPITQDAADVGLEVQVLEA